MKSNTPSGEFGILFSAIGITSTVIVFLSVVIIGQLRNPDRSIEADSSTQGLRLEILDTYRSTERKKANNAQWISSTPKIARIPIKHAKEIVLKKYEKSQDISFGSAPNYSAKAISQEYNHPTRDAERDEQLIRLSKNPEALEEGLYQFEGYCIQCHVVGPDTPGDGPEQLFDGKWYYGSHPSQIEQIVLNGIIEKGMPPWEGILSKEVTGQITAYLLSQQD